MNAAHRRCLVAAEIDRTQHSSAAENKTRTVSIDPRQTVTLTEELSEIYRNNVIE